MLLPVTSGEVIGSILGDENEEKTMSKIITKKTITKVKEAFDLGEYASAHTALRQVDGGLRGPSPFAEGDEDAFFVDVKKQRFSCKASGQSGDIIAYERALNGTEFVETVEFLALLKGIELGYVVSETSVWHPDHKSNAA